jgi:WD40 repeat protein
MLDGATAAAASGAITWWQRPTALLVGAAVLLAAGAAAAWLATPVPEPPLRIVQLEESVILDTSRVERDGLLLSPDGTTILFRVNNELWVRRLDEAEPWLLAEGVAAAFSPDGREVVLDNDSELLRVSLVSGASSKLADSSSESLYGVHWGTSGRLLQTRGGDYGLQQFDPGTGESAPLLRLGPGDTRFVSPWELPNGDVMFSLLGQGVIEVFDGQSRHTLFEVTTATVESAVFAPNGHVVWSQWGTNEGIWAAPYSIAARTFSGEPIRLSSVAGTVRVARNGLLAIFPRDTRGAGEAAAVLVARDGSVVRELVPSRAGVSLPRLSPNGRQLALTWQSGSGDRRVFVYELDRGIGVELGAGAPGNASWPEWLPDGSAVVFQIAGSTNDNKSIVVEDAAGSPDRQVLVEDTAHNSPFSVSADGKLVVYGGIDGDIWYVETAGGDPIRFRETVDIEAQPALSPDGRTIAYSRLSTGGTSGLFVERFPEGGNLQPVDVDSWDHPRWKHDGTALYYSGAAGITAVSFDPEAGLLTSRPETLFGEVSILGGFDVTRDGEFVVPRQARAESAVAPRLPILIENWMKLLER